MSKIQIRCPICGKWGFIEIPEVIIKNVSRGVIAVNIANKRICEHSFIAYIDKNLEVRDYFTTDYQVEIPEITPKTKLEKEKIPEKEFLDGDLIKINLPAIMIAYVLKAIITKQKILILSDQKFLYKHILNFFNYITENYFETNIDVGSEEEYKANKKKYKNYMIFENNQIVQNQQKIIDPKKLKVEKQIVNNFLTEQTSMGLIFIKNEIFKAYKLAQFIADYINNQIQIKKENREKIEENVLVVNFLDDLVNKEKVFSLKISTELEKKFGIKIQKQFLNFLLEIVQSYFNVDVEKAITLINV
jgi:hypothetical protein